MMKQAYWSKSTKVFLFGLACFAATATSLRADTEGVIQSVIGHILLNDQGTRVVIHADGTLSGTFNGISFAGSWTLEDGKYCSDVSRGLESAPACMTATLAQNTTGETRGIVFEGNGTNSYFDVLN